MWLFERHLWRHSNLQRSHTTPLWVRTTTLPFLIIKLALQKRKNAKLSTAYTQSSWLCVIYFTDIFVRQFQYLNLYYDGKTKSPLFSFTSVIVCLTQVWQSLFPFFCDKTFEFAMQTCQHLRSSTMCLYQHTFCLNIAKCWFCSLGINPSNTKICPLPANANNTNTLDVYCWQWANFKMGSNE